MHLMTAPKQHAPMRHAVLAAQNARVVRDMDVAFQDESCRYSLVISVMIKVGLFDKVKVRSGQ